MLDEEDKNLTTSYVVEFIEQYIDNLRNFDPTGINPALTKKIIKQSGELRRLNCIFHFSSQLNEASTLIETKLKVIEDTLNGSLEYSGKESGLFFPVLEKNVNENAEEFGLLESITIQIKGAKRETSFHITPSGREIEKLLNEQIEISWKYVLTVLNKYVRKINPYHQIFIHFDKKLGDYTGNSLGAALTIALLQELLKFYNSPTIIKYNGLIAVTGGLDKQGSILQVSKENLEKKVNTAFFSPVQSFVIVEEEKIIAAERLSALQKEYPKRNLKIVGVEDFVDLLNRRNIVEIKKQKAVVRSVKFAVRHWAAFLLLAAVLFLVYVGRFYDFDNNPAILENNGNWLSVQNKNSKELWRHKMTLNSENELLRGVPLLSEKLVDIDFDGTNEVILAFEDRTQFKPIKEPGGIVCYSNDKKEIWEYYFRDTINSVEMTHSNVYNAFIIDTITFKNNKALVCFATNDLYPCAIYFLDLKSGIRMGPTLWHTGHLGSALVGDFNGDGEIELVCEGINNVYGRIFIYSIDLNKIGGQAPADGSRKFKDLPFAIFNEYLLLPRSDYSEYFNLPWNFMIRGGLSYYKESNIFYLYLLEGKLKNLKGIQVRLDDNLDVVLIDPSREFEVARDSLVAQGELNPPYSHTKEYKNYLFNQIRHWDGEKFVGKEDLK